MPIPITGWMTINTKNHIPSWFEGDGERDIYNVLTPTPTYQLSAVGTLHICMDFYDHYPYN